MINSEAPDILKEIVRAKKIRVESQKSAVSLIELENSISTLSTPLNFAGRLMGFGTRVIAEVKKASPSNGLFRDELDVSKLARTYGENGAAAISVLTNEDHFKGSIDDLEAVQKIVRPMGIPVLRKEFVFDPYQIYEARANGADAILLIVSMLNEKTILDFMSLAKSMWLQCLVEVHNEHELETAVKCNAELIGINNRDLRTFETTLDVTQRIAPLVPEGVLTVSESGISTKADVDRIKSYGINAILVGESLVRSDDTVAALKELL